MEHTYTFKSLLENERRLVQRAGEQPQQGETAKETMRPDEVIVLEDKTSELQGIINDPNANEKDKLDARSQQETFTKNAAEQNQLTKKMGEIMGLSAQFLQSILQPNKQPAPDQEAGTTADTKSEKANKRSAEERIESGERAIVDFKYNAEEAIAANNIDEAIVSYENIVDMNEKMDAISKESGVRRKSNLAEAAQMLTQLKAVPELRKEQTEIDKQYVALSRSITDVSKIDDTTLDRAIALFERQQDINYKLQVLGLPAPSAEQYATRLQRALRMKTDRAILEGDTKEMLAKKKATSLQETFATIEKPVRTPTSVRIEASPSKHAHKVIDMPKGATLRVKVDSNTDAFDFTPELIGRGDGPNGVNHYELKRQGDQIVLDTSSGVTYRILTPEQVKTEDLAKSKSNQERQAA